MLFLRKDNKVCLVTAKHVLSGCENDSTKSNTFPDKHYVFLGSYAHSLILNTKILKTKLPCGRDDILVIPVLDTTLFPFINSVENFITQPLKYFKDIYIYGYPMKSYTSDMFKSLPDAAFMNIHDSPYHFTKILLNNNSIDTLSSAVSWLYNSVPSNLMHGYSGSPIFLQSKSNEMWRLIGLLSSAKDLGKNSVIIRLMDIEAILDKLK